MEPKSSLLSIPLVPVVTHMQAAHILPTYFFNLHFNMILTFIYIINQFYVLRAMLSESWQDRF